MAGAVTVLERIEAAGVVPVIVLDDPETAGALGTALGEAGLPCVEVTFRKPVAEAAIERLAADPRLTVGAGTVLSPRQVDRAARAGARFVVSPGFDADVVRRCRELDLTVIPGVATATEIIAALREQVGTVKLFPAGALGGLAMVRALAGPFPDLRFVPTGGITQADLAAYLGCSAVLAVGGSWVAERGLLRERRLDEIARRAQEAARLVAETRS